MSREVKTYMKTVLFYLTLLQTSIKASMSNRLAFLIETSLMIANNLIFVAIWWVFFFEFQDVAGWSFTEMTLLIAIGSGGYGLMLVCFGGTRILSLMIVGGDLDPFMTQPKNLLLHVAGSKSFSKGWGHLMTALLLLPMGGVADLYSFALAMIGLICGGLIFTAVNTVAHCLPFWAGPIEGVAKKYCDAVYLFALYPTHIYSGLLQIVMFTLIPAGVIGFLPVDLIRTFSWLKLFALIGSSLTFFAIAFAVFYSGLRRYESGNQFGLRS